MSVSSTKPYLVRAIHEWCLDQGLTPHIAVHVDEHVVVPPGYVQDGQIVLNLGPDATHGLVIGNDMITFGARFGGVAHELFVPVTHVIAVYARENGQGMAFELELPAEGDAPEGVEGGDMQTAGDEPEGPDDGPDGGGSSGNARGSHLKVVK